MPGIEIATLPRTYKIDIKLDSVKSEQDLLNYFNTIQADLQNFLATQPNAYDVDFSMGLQSMFC